MRHLSELIQRLRTLASRKQLERDLDDELGFHLAMREAELRQEGLTAEDARNMARRRFGNRALLRERTRHVWLFSSVEPGCRTSALHVEHSVDLLDSRSWPFLRLPSASA